MEFDVKKVFYHTFTVSRNAEKLTTAPDHGLGPKQRDYLVVCGEHKLQFISLPDYHFYYYEIPFKVRNVFPCATSLLVERFYDSSTEQNFHSHDTFHLYSLSGPFGELLPVIYKTNSFHPQWKFCWQSHQDEGGIVDADRNFVVVYDQKEKVHRIYMARETEEQEVHAAIRYVETLRKQHDSTMFASSLAPHSAGRTTHFDPTLRSPAMAALSDVISSDIDGRSPMTSQIRSSFGHSTPNNPGAGGFPGNLPTPIYDGNNDGHTWGHTPNTPRVNTRGGLERNIHTRTLARMVIDDAPGTSSSPTYARLQTTASPFHRTHLSQLCRRGDSNAELLKDFTRMIRDTPRNFTKNTQHPENDVDFGDLERDPDVDLLLSKLCLECVYVEPKQGAMEKANKVFVSTFLSDMYLNLVSAAGATMTVIPVWKNATTTRNNLTTKKYEPVTVDCIEATYVLKSGVTIVLGPEFTTTMYGGSEKIAPIFIDEISNTRNSLDFRFHPFSANRIMLVNHMRCIVLKIPETVTCLSANVFMKTCFVHLDREFAQKILRKWKAVKRDVDVNKTDFEHQELVGVVVFMLEQVGVRVSKMTDQPRPDTPEGHGGKQMRPRMSQAEVIEMMRTYFEDMTFASRSELQKESDNVVRCRFTVELDSTEEGRKHARSLLDAVHSQCEDWAAQTLMHTVMMELVPYAFILSKVLNFHEYEAYYAELYRTLLTRVSVEYQISEEVHQKFLETVTPPAPCWSLNELVARVIFERATSENLGTLPSALSKESLQLLTVIATSRNFIETDADCKRWIGNNWKLRLGLCNDSSKAFWKIQKDFRSNAPGRANQIMTLFRLDRTVMEYMVPGIKVILLKIQTDAYAGATSIKPKKCIYATPEEQSSIAQLRWKNDIRRNNVHLMLSSSRPILIATNILIAFCSRRNDDDNMKEMQDRFLSQTSYRTFSQPFGRAFFEFRTSVPSLLTGIYIPRLCLGGMVYPSRVSCDPPSTDQFKMHTEWGNFYNALSSALRIGGSDTVKIDNEWIVMVSKNIKSTAVVGGLVLGFGLNGHLAPFNMYHAHQMLSTFDKFHSVGLLLGLSASNITTCDNQIHKILATYLGFLMGPTPLEIRLDYTIQTSAISGLGLLFADSGNMNIAKKLINEIGKAATKDEEPVTDRSAYKLSAGFSLGLIMLGKGNGSATSVIPFKQNIPPLSQRLIYMMNGMRRDMCVFLPQTITPVVNDTPNLPFSNGGLMSTSQMANHVKENDNINIHQSAEPAALALGMMFMKTNNKYIASQLALPNTITDIERIKPDSMYARVLAYCLIMWDRIEPTKKFVKSLIPQVIGKYAVNALHFGIPIQKDDDGEDIQEPTDLREEQYWRNQVDTSTVSQTYLYTVSAACMAIALKYSSCGGPEEDSLATEAFKVIEFYTKVVLPEGQSRKDTGSMRMCNYAGQYTRSSVFAMLVTAMSILRVGTGDVEAMRYARLLRVCDRPDSSDWMATGKKHFEQMVAHQALGILMMGEGRYAFKKDNLSIALTIISTYPAIPQTVSDNSHYHQPLRFLWSMAVEPRLVVPYDVSESCVVEVDVLIVMKPRKEGEDPIAYKQKAPSLLPPLEDLLSISVGGGNYELVHINLRTEEELKVVKDVMSVGQGRIMLKRYSVDSPDMQIKESAELYEKTFNVLDLLQREDTALELDEDEIMKTIEKMEQELSLNSSDDYPNVQVQLNSVRDVTRRTPTELAEMQKRALHLLGGSLDLWRDEVNVSNSIHRLAESFQTMQI
ncbi:hypothetical protein L5515_014258 [Caenorhabditis briggsae]|uniref:Anaphase-promoting complex subunit 1 n=1 Tax=Caenorhabditis briggsae TaxID=6238 RepID=A0AAE9ECV2_CAEBR|nr:hypothetical protein L5515_014258 [Caenorhabditis briggsae]